MATIHPSDLSAYGPLQAAPEPGSDRKAAFRVARRWTGAVRLMRWLFPACSALLVLGYIAVAAQKAGWGAAIPEIALRQILPEDLAMNNPRYEGFGKDGSSYVFTAKTARQDLRDLSVIKLDGISGTITQADKTKTQVAAVRGTFEHEEGILELAERIDVVSEGGLKARLTQATILTKESVLNSNEPVVVEFPSGNIRSRTMTLRQKANEVAFIDEVEARLVPSPREPEAAQDAETATGLIRPSGAPIDIIADRLDIHDSEKSAVFSGKVKAVQADSILSTPELTVLYDGAPLGARGADAAGAGAGASAAEGKLRRIIAKGPVVMTRESPDVVTSDNAEFDAQRDTAILTGNVVLASAQDRRATCERAELDQRADTALLTGNVVVVQGKNQLTGRRLFIDRKTRRAELTSPAVPNAGSPGRISALLYQTQSPKSAAASAEPPAAGGQLVEMGQFKTDPDAPVDVEADKLDIDDAAHVAVFQGAVRTIQGEFLLESAELSAYYTGEAGLADVSTVATGGAKPKRETELTRIEAKKDVTVTSKDGRRVTGDWATFDAKANTVTVGGDVVLSENKNVVRGTRLVIDMASGRSTIDTAPAKAVALPAGGGWRTETPGEATPENRGRASAVFYPNKAKDGAASKPGADSAEKGAGQ